MTWLSGYKYCKKGAVNSTTAGAQTNYQLELIVGESSCAGGEDIDCENHCHDFPNDIRFTRDDGVTKHDYEIKKLEGSAPNRKATVIIEVVSIPASGSVDFYMYYSYDSEYEDFTTFTEVDVAGDRIQKTANHIDHRAERDETTYLYKDYGAAHFDDFEHKIKVKAVSSDNGGFSFVWMLANDLGNYKALNDASKTAIGLSFYYTTSLQVKLEETYSSVMYGDPNIAGFDLGDWIYAKLVKSGTSLTCFLYSDSGYSTLVDTLSLSLHADHSFRYLYGCNTYNDSSNYYLNSDIEDFNIGIENESNGGDTNEFFDDFGIAYYTGSWATKTAMPHPVADVPCVVHNDKLYSFGGYGNGGVDPKKYTQEYTPSTNTWTGKTDMPTARWGAAAAKYDGKAYVFGGKLNGNSTNKCECYDLSGDSWTTKTDLPSAITAQGLMAVAVGTKIYLFYRQYTYEFDPAGNGGAGSYTQKLSTNPVDRSWATCAYINVAGEDRIYLIGGYDYNVGDGTNKNYYYKPSTNTWSSAQSVAPYSSYGCIRESCIYDNKIYYGFGQYPNGTFHKKLYRYNPSDDTWSSALTEGSYVRDGVGAGIINDKLYVVGGRIGGMVGLEYNEEFVPTTNPQYGFNLDKWTEDAVNDITHLIDNGFRFKDATKSAGTYWIYDNSDIGSQHQAKWAPLNAFIVEWDSKISDTAAAQMGEGGVALIGSDNKISANIDHSDDVGDGISIKVSHIFVEATTGAEITGLANGDERDFRYIVNGTSVKIYEKAASADTYNLKADGNSSDIAKVALTAGAFGGYSFLDHIEIRKLRIRKYASPEPTWGSWGTEQEESEEKFSSDSGVGGDASVSLFAFLDKSDGGSGVDEYSALSVPFFSEDLGAGTDAISASLSSRLETETGTGVDSLIELLKVVAKFGSDSSIGADALLLLLAEVEQSDVGEGLDALGVRLFSGSDMGVGADAILATLSSRVEVDTGIGVDVLIELLKLIAKYELDTGAGVDTITNFLAEIPASDLGVGADALIEQIVAIVQSEIGGGSEDAVIGLRSADAGGGTDALANFIGLLEWGDAGSGSDALAKLIGRVDEVDSGGGVDAVSDLLIELWSSDLGTSVDTLAALLHGVGESDLGSGSETEIRSICIYLLLKLLQEKGLNMKVSQERVVY